MTPLALFLLLFLNSHNAVFSQPESVEGDPAGNNIVISKFTPSTSSSSTPRTLHEFKKAGVSSLNRMPDDRLIIALQNFAPANNTNDYDKIAVSFSSDEGASWSPLVTVTVDGFDKNKQRPFDPTVVILKDGRVRLYFSSSVMRKNGRQSMRRIHSAIGTDGIQYKYEPGLRFAVANMPVGDSAVAQDAKTGLYHMTAPIHQEANRVNTPHEIDIKSITSGGSGGARQMSNMPPCGPNEIPTPEKPCARPIENGGGSGGNSTQGKSIAAYHAVSEDGLNFKRLDDIVELANNNSDSQWFGNLVYGNGQLLFFGSQTGPWPQASVDGGSAWHAAEFSVKIPGIDPSAVRLKDGSWLLSYIFRPPPSK